MTERFLSLKEVGERLGVKNPAAKGYNRANLPRSKRKPPGRSSASAGAILLAGWRLSDAVGFVPLEGFLHVFVSKGFADCHGCLLHE